jgi:hypothetical protein
MMVIVQLEESYLTEPKIIAEIIVFDRVLCILSISAWSLQTRIQDSTSSFVARVTHEICHFNEFCEENVCKAHFPLPGISCFSRKTS